MKSFSTLLSCTLASVFIGSLWLNTEKKISTNTSSEKNILRENEEEESVNGPAEYEKAAAYWYNLRKNPATGIFDFNDYYKAVAQAKANTASRAGTPIGLVWDELGPDNVGGRTRAVLFDKFHPGVVYAGAVGGGIWVSTNNGQQWKKYDATYLNQNMDQMEALTVASIAQASNGDIYFGTGEGHYTFFGTAVGGFPGEGVWVKRHNSDHFDHLLATKPSNSNNAGDIWAQVNSMACGLSLSDSLLVFACNGNGLYRSVDGGATWAKPTGQISATGMSVGATTDGAVFSLQQSTGANRIYTYSNTTGTCVSQMNADGLPASFGGRCEVAVSEGNPNYCYAVNTKSGGLTDGIYKSTDGGMTWALIGLGNATASTATTASFNPTGQQGDYDLLLAAHSTNPDLIFLGGQLQLWRYTPALGWSKVSGFNSSNYIHPDMHTMRFDPFDANHMIMGCDGGLYASSDIQSSYPHFGDINKGYAVTQLYSLAVSPNGYLLAGAQDNGNNFNDFTNNSPMSFSGITGGDGARCFISQWNPLHAVVALAAPEGALYRTSNAGTSAGGFYDLHIDHSSSGSSTTPDGTPDEGADFIMPHKTCEWLSVDTTYHAMLALGTSQGSTHVWVCPGVFNFATNPTWYRLQVPNAGNVTALTFSADCNTLFVGTATGKIVRYDGLRNAAENDLFQYDSAGVFYGDSAGITYTITTVAASHYIFDIAIDPTDPDFVVATGCGYGTSPNVWKCSDANSAMTFTSIQGDLPAMPCYGVTINTTNGRAIVIGTELGVWATTNDGTNWTDETVNGGTHAVTPVVMQNWVNGQLLMYASTHGRGVFRTSTISGIKDLNGNATGIQSLNIFPNPASANSNLQFALGKNGMTTIRIIDLSGKLMKEISNYYAAGQHIVALDLSKLSIGQYIVAVESNGVRQTTKLVITH